MKKDVAEITKDLIAIPSWVDQKTNEINIGEYIYQYLKQNTSLTVNKQFVKNGRFNVVAKDNYPTKLLLVGHMDTVEPKTGWKEHQLSGITKEGKLYGLGANDMKSGLAAILSAITFVKKTKGLACAFYIDEEYDFLGTSALIKKLKGKIKPKLVVSGDGSDLAIQNACRGLIELSFFTRGKTGHAANPKSGKNAIEYGLKILSSLKREIFRYKSNNLGETSMNIAYFQGGLDKGKDKTGNQLLGKQGNNIADIAEVVLDIRPGSSTLNARVVVEILKKLVNKYGLNLESVKVRHDDKCWITQKDDLKEVSSLIKKETGRLEWKNPGKSGFIDIQMFWETFDKTPCVTIGAGPGNLAHKPNEYIEIEKLIKLEKIFKKIIKKFGGEYD